MLQSTTSFVHHKSMMEAVVEVLDHTTKRSIHMAEEETIMQTMDIQNRPVL